VLKLPNGQYLDLAIEPLFASDPEDWQWHDGADRLHGKLVALGIPHTAILDLQAGGHGPAYYDSVAPDAIRFLLTALEAEGRRLA
jgi:hypothetical protein